MLASRIQTNPAGYAQEASRNPEKFREDLKLFSDNMDNPLVQQAMSKGFLEAAKKMSSSLPGGELTGPAAEQLAPRILDFLKDSKMLDVVKQAMPMMDMILKDKNVQAALQMGGEPLSKASETVKSFLPEGISMSGLQDLGGVIGGLTKLMTTTLPEMATAAISSSKGMTIDGLAGGTVASGPEQNQNQNQNQTQDGAVVRGR